MKTKILVSSIITIAVCLCLIGGSTFALFTSKTTTNIAVTSGNVNVSASIIDDATYPLLKKSLGDSSFTTDALDNGGSVSLDANTGKLTLSNLTPGDAVSFKINVANTGNVPVKYRVTANNVLNKNATEYTGKTVTDLAKAMKVTVHIKTADGVTTFVIKEAGTDVWKETSWYTLDANITEPEITAEVEFVTNTPEENNKYNDNDNDPNTIVTADISFVVEAVQANGVDANGELITGS